VFRAAGSDRVALVTDAIASAGSPSGCHQLGGQPVQIVEGAARLVDTDSLAGSLLTMDRAVHNAVVYAAVPLLDSIRAATHTPATAIGIADRVGSLENGKQADLCVLDSELRLVAVMRAGRWIGAAPNPAASGQPG
jgi:N-acetylglucosamine-6-phosphate deacetylase